MGDRRATVPGIDVLDDRICGVGICAVCQVDGVAGKRIAVADKDGITVAQADRQEIDFKWQSSLQIVGEFLRRRNCRPVAIELSRCKRRGEISPTTPRWDFGGTTQGVVVTKN